ncbi:MATE family efflux transporter [Persicobacter psychrovividus]|uniref:Multidrug-efflux transporter n=1 Tax=Persicobacter psychrovividus TaxID=387638 RepID=A0ABN6LCU3_9BACT|nr:MATE family efflux transporter [Persicobacter psychrovividus]
MLQKYYPYYRRLMTLALPLVMTQAGQVVVSLVDNAMVGRVGTQELASASFANSVFTIILVFGMGISFAITPMIGHAIGASDRSAISRIIKNSWVLGTASALFLAMLCYLGSLLMPFLGQPEKVVELAIPYFRILAVSLIPFMGFMVLKQIGEGLGNTMMAMIATVASNLLNILLNWVLIFGHWGAPALGLNGAGIATLIARILMPFLLYYGLKNIKAYRGYFVKTPEVHVAWHEIKKLLTIGLPIAFQLVLEVSIFAIGAVMMGWIGDVPLAAHQVALGLGSMTFMISNGVAQATTIRVSYQIGEKNDYGLRMASFSAMHLVLFFMGLSCIGFYVLRYQLPLIFTPDVAVVNQAAILLIVAAIFQLFDGLQVVCLGILRGMADVKVPMLIAAVCYLIIGIPVSYICAFTFGMGPVGIWVGFVVGLALAGIAFFVRIWKLLYGDK